MVAIVSKQVRLLARFVLTQMPNALNQTLLVENVMSALIQIITFIVKIGFCFLASNPKHKSN
jgi:hypothetical protein